MRVWWSRKRVVLILSLAAMALAATAFGIKLARHYLHTPSYLVVHGDAAERRWAVKELAVRRGRTPDWKRIAPCLTDPDETVRLAALGAFGTRGEARHLPELIRFLAPTEPLIIRTKAAEVIASIGGTAAEATLIKLFEAPDPELRALAAASAGRYGWQNARPGLIRLLDDPSPSVKEATLRALTELMPQAPAGNTPNVRGPARLVFEAENAWDIRGNYEVAPSARELAALPRLSREDPLEAGVPGFSGSGWLQILEGGGGNHEWLGGESGSIDIGRADYPIFIGREGTYRLWARMWCMDKCGNSFYYWFDRQHSSKIGDESGHGDAYRVWAWAPASETVYLTAGLHMLHLEPREDGVRLDQFVLSPGDIDPLKPGAGPALPANYDPREFASPPAQVTISRESEAVDSQGRLYVMIRVVRGAVNTLRGTLKIDAEDGSFDGPRELPVSLSGAERGLARDFTVSLAAGAACRERVLRARFEAADPAIPPCEARLLFTKPWPWQLSGPHPTAPAPAQLAGDSTLKWQTLLPEKFFNRYQTMDFAKPFGKSAWGYACLRTQVRTEKGGRLLWLLNSDDAATVYLDGREVIQGRTFAPAEGFLRRQWVEVPPGEHVITAVCYNQDLPDGDLYHDTQNYWLFRLRVRIAEHIPSDVVGIPWTPPAP